LAWIDPITTALVQAGLVSDFVPDVTSYMNIGMSVPSTKIEHMSNYGCFTGLPLMALNTSTSPNAREDLYSLISAMARPHLSGLHIRLPILIKGAPGVGKFTAVIDVARRLGLHVQEVNFSTCQSRQNLTERHQANCHHIVGDTDVVTEAALRVQFDRAAACSPCILVLRHLDALGQSTQPDGLAQGMLSM
jgi:peroxin-6